VPHQTEVRLKPLWLAAQSGDEQAYAESLALMAGHLRGYFRRRMPFLANDIEDLVQETLLAVHLQRGTYDAAYPVTAWLLAIARHKLVDLWRRRGRKENLHDDVDDLVLRTISKISQTQPLIALIEFCNSNLISEVSARQRSENRALSNRSTALCKSVIE
jgi:DNA-directed RNA polymerase specialized sigma24 family protein